MHLPQLSLSQKKYGGNEIFFAPDQELMRVLSQNNQVYLVLELPGGENKIIICFPTQTVTRIYATNGQQQYFLCESEKDKHSIWTAPVDVHYRYGMKLFPWMFLGDLAPDTPVCQDYIVNYIILNCCVGHQGVNIRLRCTRDREDRASDWLEIHQFDTGNEYRFAEKWNVQSKMLMRFVPKIPLTRPRAWTPVNDWGKYTQTKIPCKI